MKALRRRTIVSAVALFAGFGMVEIYRNWMPPVPAAAQVLAPLPTPSAWTAVGSTGVVDESGLSTFGLTGPGAGYRAGIASVAPIEFRYNVVNTNHAGANAAVPPWTTLELGAVAPGTSVVDATLYRVNRCTGYQSVLCQTRIASTSAGTCRLCTVPAGSFNFTSYLYYVRVAVDRNAANETPRVNTLRIY
jgi:hypothetical protein